MRFSLRAIVPALLLITGTISPALAQPNAVEVVRIGGLADAQMVFIDSSGHELAATYDEEKQLYRFPVDAGQPRLWGSIRVTHPDYEPQTRVIKPETDSVQMRVELGTPGSEYTWLSNRRIPYTPNDYELGAYVPRMDSAQVQQIVDTLGITVAPSIESSALFILRSTTPFGRTSDPRLAWLRSRLGSVGPVARVGNGVLILPEFSVRFSPRIRSDSSAKIMMAAGAVRYEVIPGTGTAFFVRLDPSINHGINQIMEALANRSDVESVSGNFLGYILRLD